MHIFRSGSFIPSQKIRGVSVMVRVECTCIVNLNITDFYVFSYSATEKTRKGFGELSCYVNLLCFIIIFFSSLLKRDCFSQSFKMQFNIWSKNHTYRAQIARRTKGVHACWGMF